MSKKYIGLIIFITMFFLGWIAVVAGAFAAINGGLMPVCHALCWPGGIMILVGLVGSVAHVPGPYR